MVREALRHIVVALEQRTLFGYSSTYYEYAKQWRSCVSRLIWADAQRTACHVLWPYGAIVLSASACPGHRHRSRCPSEGTEAPDRPGRDRAKSPGKPSSLSGEFAEPDLLRNEEPGDENGRHPRYHSFGAGASGSGDSNCLRLRFRSTSAGATNQRCGPYGGGQRILRRRCVSSGSGAEIAR